MNSLKVLCLFICVAGWAVTAINMNDGDKMAKASLKLEASTTSSLPLKFSKKNAAVQLNFLQVNSGKLDARQARKG